MMTVASAADATERMREFNALKLDYVKADAASLALAEEVHEAEATDEEINALLDTSDEPDNDRTERLITNLDSPGLKFFLTTLLLSKVIRNNELLDNEELKAEAVSKAIDAWCYFASEGNFLFTKLGKGEGAPETLREIFALGR